MFDILRQPETKLKGLNEPWHKDQQQLLLNFGWIFAYPSIYCHRQFWPLFDLKNCAWSESVLGQIFRSFKHFRCVNTLKMHAHLNVDRMKWTNGDKYSDKYSESDCGAFVTKQQQLKMRYSIQCALRVWKSDSKEISILFGAHWNCCKASYLDEEKWKIVLKISFLPHTHTHKLPGTDSEFRTGRWGGIGGERGRNRWYLPVVLKMAWKILIKLWKLNPVRWSKRDKWSIPNTRYLTHCLLTAALLYPRWNLHFRLPLRSTCTSVCSLVKKDFGFWAAIKRMRCAFKASVKRKKMICIKRICISVLAVEHLNTWSVYSSVRISYNLYQCLVMGRKLYQNDMIHIRKASFRKKMQLQRTDACHLGIRPERLENPKAIHYDYCALGTHTHAFHVEILRATATVCSPTNATMHGIFEALDHMGKQQKKARGQGSQVKWLEADNRIEWNIQVNFAFVVGHCLNLSDPKNQYTHTHHPSVFGCFV